MTSIKAGDIFERQDPFSKNNKLFYEVDLFKGKKKSTFSSFELAHNFIKKNMNNIINTNEIQSISVKFTRKSNSVSYLIFENIYDNEKLNILEHEETEFDYMKTHALFFKEHATRKVINDRYYSFHDIARSNALTSKNSLFYKIFINIFSIICSIVLIFLALHYHHASTSSFKLTTYETHVLDFSIIISSIIMISGSILSLISYLAPILSLNKKKWDYDEIDWRKMNHLRNKMKITLTCLWVIVLGLWIYFWTVYFRTSLWTNIKTDKEQHSYIVFILLSFLLFSIIEINAAINTFKIFSWRKDYLSNLYNEEEISLFKSWIKFKSEEVIYKTNIGLFLFPFESNNQLVLARIKAANELRKNTTKEEKKLIKEKIVNRYNIAIDVYKKTPEWIL